MIASIIVISMILRLTMILSVISYKKKKNIYHEKI